MKETPLYLPQTVCARDGSRLNHNRMTTLIIPFSVSKGKPGFKRLKHAVFSKDYGITLFINPHALYSVSF